MPKANYALRLQRTLKAEAEQLAREEGTTLNQLINVALAEKLAAIRTAQKLTSPQSRAEPQVVEKRSDKE